VKPVDVNGDGWIDLVVVGGNNVSPHLFLNQGNGWFTDATSFVPAGGSSTITYAADFDGDGKTDFFFDFFGSFGFARGLKPLLPAQPVSPPAPTANGHQAGRH
jgi:hypothetical protein